MLFVVCHQSYKFYAVGMTLLQIFNGTGDIMTPTSKHFVGDR
ncbi:MAG: hypothetical protein ACJASL_001432 [Paraglaciecola sp.]|jgi:hypothetical protein